jgi:hypothetical protein
MRFHAGCQLLAERVFRQANRLSIRMLSVYTSPGRFGGLQAPVAMGTFDITGERSLPR